ncbi:FAD dependent oxidoreductase [Hyaloraphidium curvatum]|nr:FAD dependent oxidoreductase [Hyaloraphidium curvatum]
MASRKALDVVICGSGAVGLFSALHLALLAPGPRRIRIVDPDGPAGERASSLRSAASCRVQFSLPENVAMSVRSSRFLSKPDASMELSVTATGDPRQPKSQQSRAPWWRDGAYLFLAGSADGAAVLRENEQVQRAAGARVALLDSPVELAARFPWLSADDLTAGALGLADEGFLDAHMLCARLRERCAQLGVEFVRAGAVDFDVSGREVKFVVVRDPAGKESRLDCTHAVLAAGAWSRPLAARAGFELPVFARRRVVYVWKAPGFASHTPQQRADVTRNVLLIDPTGVYFRREGFPDTFIGGLSPPEDEDPDFDPDDVSSFAADSQADADYFNDRVWPLLAARVPAFAELRLQSAWAGWYEVNAHDHNLLIGRPAHLDNLVVSAGSSGHGLQHSPAQGRAVAELLVHGKYVDLDLSRFAVTRVAEGRKEFERNIV